MNGFRNSSEQLAEVKENRKNTRGKAKGGTMKNH